MRRDSLPKVLLSTVVRAAERGESHGGIYIVDLERGKHERVLDWDNLSIAWDGRGGDRGLRGIAIRDNTVFVATNDAILAYSLEFKLIGSYPNRYLAHCHELAMRGDTLYVISSDLDALLAFDIKARMFTLGYWLMMPQGRVRIVRAAYQRMGPWIRRLRRRRLSRGIARLLRGGLDRFGRVLIGMPRVRSFDPNGGSGPQRGSGAHLNNVVVDEGQLYLSGLFLPRLVRLRGDNLEEFAALPLGTHNARPYRGGVIYNNSGSDETVYAARTRRSRTVIPTARFLPADIPRTKLPESVARAGFARGMCTTKDGIVITGVSPATVVALDPDSGEILRTVNLATDVRISTHAVHVWPS